MSLGLSLVIAFRKLSTELTRRFDLRQLPLVHLQRNPCWLGLLSQDRSTS